jgi:hypothetical protein
MRRTRIGLTFADLPIVIPANAGWRPGEMTLKALDPRLRGDDGRKPMRERVVLAWIRNRISRAYDPLHPWSRTDFHRTGTNFTSEGDTAVIVCTVSPNRPLRGSRAITTNVLLC